MAGILIMTVIAILRLVRSRMAANEPSAVAFLRTINAGEVTYYTTYLRTFGTLTQFAPGEPVSKRDSRLRWHRIVRGFQRSYWKRSRNHLIFQYVARSQ